MKTLNTTIALLFVLFFYGFQGIQPSGSTDAGHEGVVKTTMMGGGYTYVEIEEGGKSVWIAGKANGVKVGDTVRTSKGTEIYDFYSKSFQRTFPSIYFVGKLEVVGVEGGDFNPEEAASPKKGKISKAKNGYTIEELFNKKKALDGKEVRVRGKIVKESGKIMGARWYHLEDGTGDKEPLNLVVTSKDVVEVGKIVLVTGILHTDKEFGAGYRYDVIIEEAKIKVE